jgi:hypothetical protein
MEASPRFEPFTIMTDPFIDLSIMQSPPTFFPCASSLPPNAHNVKVEYENQFANQEECFLPAIPFEAPAPHEPDAYEPVQAATLK